MPETGTLKVDGQAVATKRMEKTLPMILQWDVRQRRGLQTTVPADRQAQQVDDQGRPPAVVTRGH
jgi:hypothetical protein